MRLRNLPVTGFATLMVALSAASVARAQPSADQDFAAAAAQSDAYEVAAGQLILAQSKDATVRAFAQEILDDHRRTYADLTAAAKASGLEPPPLVIGGDQQRMLSALQSQTGPDLDRSFVTQQVNAHTAALVTERDYLAAGEDPNLRQAAQRTIPTIEHHLQKAKQMAAAWPSR